MKTNGAYATLEQVMDFHNKGGGASIGLDVTEQTLPFKPLQLNHTEIADIIWFLHSITDSRYEY